MDEDREKKGRGFTVSDRRFWVKEAEAPAPGEAGAAGGPSAPGAEGAAPAAERPRYPSYVEQLRAEIEEKDRLIAALRSGHKDALKDFGKAKERVERNIENDVRQRVGKLLGGLLEVVDNMEKVLSAAGPQGQGRRASIDPQVLVEAVDISYRLLVRRLGELGLSRLEAVGKPFDPRRHEAVGTQPVPRPELNGIVLGELRAGFMLDERLLRPAQVIVGKYGRPGQAS